MDQWKGRLLTGLGYLAFSILAILLLYILTQAWVDKLDSRWWTTLGFLAITGLTVLFWKKLHLWSRVYLLLVYLIFLIGFYALLYGPEAKESFLIANLHLSFLVNFIIFLSLSLSLFFILMGLKLSRNIKIGVGVFGGLCSVPYLIGLIKDIPLPEILRGAPYLGFLPWFLQPAFLGIVLLLPILMIFLFRDFFKAMGDENRSTLRSAMSIFAALIPLAVGLMVIFSQTQQGIVTRYFADHNFASFKKDRVEKTPALDWKSPPVKPESGNRFWVEWEGMIQVPQDGDYEFQIVGDGNAFLYLDGKRVFGGSSKNGKMKLNSGRIPFRAGAIEDKKEGKFKVQWKGPGDETFHDINPKALSFTDDQLKFRRTPRQAAQVGIDWLQSASYDWQKSKQCFGCHVQGQVLMGLAVSKDNDYRVNGEYYDALFDFTRDKQNKNGTYHSGHHLAATQFAILGLASVQGLDSSKKNKNFLKSIDWLLGRQKEDGSFPIDHNEAPIDQGTIMTTANTVLSLMQAFKETGDKKYKNAAEKGLKWIEAAETKSTQDKIQKILSLTQYGSASQARVAQQIVEQLKKEQQADGGWMETPSMKGSNAYATGQVLYAFKKAGVSVNAAEFSKGVRFLLDNQKVSGAWPAMNTQAHRPSEFVPTMWAVIGLAGSFGEIIPEILQPADRSSVEGKVVIKGQVTNFTDSTIAKVVFELDGQALGAGVEKDKYYVLDWNTQGLKEGEHKIKMTATNKAGKFGEASILVYSGLGVQVKFVTPNQGATVFAKQLLEAEAKALFGTKIEKVEFFVQPVGDDAGKTKIGEQLEGGENNRYGLEWDASTFKDGAYKLTALATNSRGQQAQDSIGVNRQSPLIVKITAPMSGQTVSGLVNCQAKVINNTEIPLDYIEFFLDGETSMGRPLSDKLEVPCNFENVALGEHTLKVTARLKDGMTAEDQIILTVGETKGPGYLKVQLKNLDQPGKEQVLYFPPDHIELLLDMSGSMWGQIQGVAKIEIAREVLEKLLKGFPKDASLGVRVYGHRSKGDCKDSELLIPFGKIDAEGIMTKINALKPKGMTPIDYSLREVGNDLKGLEGSRVVILVTDGIESCKGDPVAAAESLMAAGLKVKIHVVGFDIGESPEALKQLEGISKVGKGLFYLAEDAAGLTDALAEAIKVTYSVYDEQGNLVFTKPLSLESNELMSGTYRVEVALDPPLVLNVAIAKGKTSTVDVIREKKKFRIESPEKVEGGPVIVPKEKAAETQPAASETQPAETQPAIPPPAETQPQGD